MSIRTNLIIGIVTLGTATAAWAQPSVTPVGPPPPAYAPAPAHEPPPAYAPAPAPEPQAEVPLGPPAWSFGFRVAGGDMLDEVGNESSFDGHGVFLRYRATPRWELELDLGKATAELTGGRVREFRPMGASLLYHLAQLGKMDLVVRGGIARADETYRTATAEVQFKATELHAGAALEYALRRDIVIGGFLRGFTLVRHVEGSGSNLAASGSQLGLSVAYRF
jgi:hypothetical protein